MFRSQIQQHMKMPIQHIAHKDENQADPSCFYTLMSLYSAKKGYVKNRNKQYSIKNTKKYCTFATVPGDRYANTLGVSVQKLSVNSVPMSVCPEREILHLASINLNALVPRCDFPRRVSAQLQSACRGSDSCFIFNKKLL